jgi:hypothetical protein
MKLSKIMPAALLLVGMALLPQTSVHALQSATAAQIRDGQRDFDWEIGTWDTHVRVLRNPLSGAAPEWTEYRGTSEVRAILDGRANMVELAVEGPAGRIDGISLRLYNPQTRQWSLNYASMRSGMLTSPVYGGFDESGRGTFYGQEMIAGRPVLVRFVISDLLPGSARFEQAFSIDGGTTWEVNWIAVDTRR